MLEADQPKDEVASAVLTAVLEGLASVTPTDAPAAAPTSDLWEEVIGQPDLLGTLAHAAADAARIRRGEPGPSMTHAWLLTGPPGSGRSTAARVFAAALQCPDGGCGTCEICRQVLGRGHADVDQFTPEKLQITAEESLELIRRASMTPIMGRWNVLIVEDADRLNDVSGNALLKSLEEPSPRTVWYLCAPTPEDVLPTIVSRTRQVRLKTPTTREVTEALVRREGVDRALASFAARAAQGHIRCARALAGDEQVRLRRSEVLRDPPARCATGRPALSPPRTSWTRPPQTQPRSPTPSTPRSSPSSTARTGRGPPVRWPPV